MNESLFQFEIVIVGAGPAGLAAACAAADCGRRVAVIDNTPRPGGQIWRGQPQHSSSEARFWIERFHRSGATWLDDTSVVAASGNWLLAEHRNRPRKIGWEKLILATGARELFLPFPGWTLPGVFGPGGLLGMVKNGWPIAGKKVVLAGTGPLLLAAALGLKQHGAKIMLLAEQAAAAQVRGLALNLLCYPRKLIQGAVIKAQLAGIPQRCSVWPVRAFGHDHVESVELTDGRERWMEACDVLACGYHLTPNLELPRLMRCAMAEGFVKVDDWQSTSVATVYCAGELTGIGGADAALIEGQIAGYAAAGEPDSARALFSRRASAHGFRRALARAFALRPEVKALATDETLLCRCEDVTWGRVKSFGNWREAKLLTRCGMGTCQGRICGSAAKVILGWENESVNPPVFPARINSLLEPLKM
jgi:NADPH-dependent 2,4-dienoyl-CoA reductase/sulfur reductase-like enzyme